MPRSSSAKPSFGGVETWVFDLDNTLYPHHLNLWHQVDARIRDFIAAFLEVTHEDAFRQEVLLALVLVPLALYAPATGPGKALMIGAVLLVLVVELLNSGIEAVTDRVSLEDHVLAKRAKDMGSAAVMISLINVPVVWLLVLLG